MGLLWECQDVALIKNVFVASEVLKSEVAKLKNVRKCVAGCATGGSLKVPDEFPERSAK